MIRFENGKWSACSEDGSTVLGVYATEEEAKNHGRETQDPSNTLPSGTPAPIQMPKEATAKPTPSGTQDHAFTRNVHRWDRGELSPPTKEANGWLRADGWLTRTGVFQYRNIDGSVRRELRLPEEVFNNDSLNSFSLVPLTNNHPPVGFLDASTAKQFSVGAVETPRKDGDRVRAKLLVTDAVTVAALEAGKRDLSCGYVCDLEESEGTYHGDAYDVIQRNIRGNHVAIVAKGRAGPEMRVRMDASQVENKSMVKIKIGGVEYEVTEQVAQAYEKQRAKMDSKEEAADAKIKDLEAKSVSADQFRASVSARVALETKSVSVLGATKFDALTDQDVRLAVLKKLVPTFDATGRSAEYISARYDAEIERFDASANALGDLRRATSVHEDPSLREDGMLTLDEEMAEADKIATAWGKQMKDAWKTPLTACAPDIAISQSRH